MYLINEKETVEFVCDIVNDENKPVFTLKKLTAGEVATIQDSISTLDEHNKIAYLAGTTGKLKVRFSVVGWKNILSSDGKEAPCNDANKEKLPPEIAGWLVSQIDKLNKLNGIPESERKN